MFQNDQLKKLDNRYNSHAYTGLMGIFMRYCHEQLEKVEFPKNISKVLEIGAGSAPHIKYIKHNFLQGNYFYLYRMQKRTHKKKPNNSP